MSFFPFSIIALLAIGATIISTLNEYLDTPLMKSILNSKSTPQTEEKPPANTFSSKLLACFSLKQNIPALTTSSDAEQIKCLHGLKAISIILIFLSLKLISIGRIPYTNRNKFTEFFNSPFSVFLRSSFLYEDVFLLISGLLASLSFIKEFSSKFVMKKVFGKYLKSFLPLFFTLIFYGFLFEHIGSGPMWNVVTKNAELCRENLWRNFMFVQNFYPFEEMVRKVFLRQQRSFKILRQQRNFKILRQQRF